MNKQPQLMDASRMRDIFTPHLPLIRDHIFLNGELGIVHGDHTVFTLLMRQKPPFFIKDHRLGIIVSGEAVINFNLQDRHLKAGTLVYIGPGTITFAQEQMLSAFNGQERDFQLSVSKDDINTAHQIMDTIWHIVHADDNYHRPTITALVAALMHHYDHLFHLQYDQQASSRSREQTIFNRFIQLVTQHCAEHHQISYYAQRMCLTERYLSTIIRQASGSTAKDWIDRALINRIKVELRHTDKSAAQIAEEMHFANPSFFSKYFRRLTGMTPKEYK